MLPSTLHTGPERCCCPLHSNPRPSEQQDHRRGGPGTWPPLQPQIPRIPYHRPPTLVVDICLVLDALGLCFVHPIGLAVGSPASVSGMTEDSAGTLLSRDSGMVTRFRAMCESRMSWLAILGPRAPAAATVVHALTFVCLCAFSFQ